jgi:hypothetical protein
MTVKTAVLRWLSAVTGTSLSTAAGLLHGITIHVRWQGISGKHMLAAPGALSTTRGFSASLVVVERRPWRERDVGAGVRSRMRVTRVRDPDCGQDPADRWYRPVIE